MTYIGIYTTWLPRQRQEASGDCVYQMQDTAFDDSQGTLNVLLIKEFGVYYTIQQWPACMYTLKEDIKKHAGLLPVRKVGYGLL